MSSQHDFIARLLSAPKYRALQLPRETVEDLIANESLRYGDTKKMQESVRKKLHQLTALYLGDPDYAQCSAELAEFSDTADLQDFADRMLSAHTSTSERLPYLQDFYQTIFAMTGKPHHIVDLACGLNPFAITRMGLDKDIIYEAFDIHLPRVQLLNQYFEKVHFPNAHAIQRDILVTPPSQQADVAFFFKEAHRMEQRHKGSNRALWQALRAKTILVSLPSSDIGKTHDMTARMENLVFSSIAGLDWSVEKMLFPDEIVFCIHKGSEQYE